MEVATIYWFNLLCEIGDSHAWLELKQNLIKSYEGRQCDNPFKKLKDLKQFGSVDEYII